MGKKKRLSICFFNGVAAAVVKPSTEGGSLSWICSSFSRLKDFCFRTFDLLLLNQCHL